MKARNKFLVLAAMLVFASAARADGIDASGFYQVSGNVTMTGTVIGPCGPSLCVESLNFSVLVLVTSFDFFGSLAYTDVLVIGPGVYAKYGPGVDAASGPIGGPWTVGVWPGYGGGNVGFYFISDSVPAIGNFNPSEIDAPGFNSPDGLPHSFSGPAFFFSCAGVVCDDFGFLYEGSQTVRAVRTPEPSTLLLLFPVLVLALWRRRGTICAS